MNLNGYLSASGCVWFWLYPFLKKISVSFDISIIEITGGSDSLKFSESASENFWSFCFRSIEEPPVLVSRKIFEIREMLVPGVSEIWKNWWFVDFFRTKVLTKTSFLGKKKFTPVYTRLVSGGNL